MGTSAARREQTADGQQSAHSLVTVDGHTVSYAEYGPTAGRPMLVFHGTPGSRLVGRLFETAASEQGVRVLAVDRPGYGRSDDWPGFTIDDVVELVDGVLTDAGIDRTAVLGFSGGGPYALALAASRPDLVQSVDLVSTAVPPSIHEDMPRQLRLLSGMARRTPRLLGGLLRTQAWLARRGRTDVVVGQYTDPETVSAGVAEAVTAEFVDALAVSRAGVIRELAREDSTWPCDIDAIDAPVRLWHGVDDANVPIEVARRLAERIPNATLTEFDTDHLGALLESRTAILAGNPAERRH